MAPGLKCTTTEDTEFMAHDGGNGSSIGSSNDDGPKERAGHRRLVHARTTSDILAAAYKVHTRLGPGLLESAYKACLIRELTVAGIKFEAEKLLPVHYDGIRVELGYRIDLIVDDAVIVEIKAIEGILPVHEAQLLSYLRLSGKRVGLLINFNVRSLRQGIRRRILGYGHELP